MNEYEQYNMKTVTLEKLQSLAFTEPVSFRFTRCQPQSVDSWRDLYGGALKQLCQKYAAAVQGALPADEVGDLKASKKMKNPYWIRRGVYAETGLSSETIARRLKQLLSACDLKLSDLKIVYYIDEERKQAFEERVEREKAETKLLQLRWDYTGSYKGARAVSFRYKNHRTRLVKSWTDLYIQFISFLADDYPRIIRDGVSFGGNRIDVGKAGKNKKAMQHPSRIGHNLFVETFGTSAMLIDRMYSALNLCAVDPSSLTINFTFKDADDAFAYLGKRGRVSKGLDSAEIANLDSRLLRRLRFLLNKHFEDGYRLESAIDRKRLSSFYEAQYREELLVEEDELRTALLTIASPIGGRIMPKKQSAIDNLMKTIMNTVAETFAAGATCIYTSKLLEAYQEELAANGVHDEKGLGELVQRFSGDSYRIKYNHICYGRRKADIESEIVNYLKENRETASLNILLGHFWYIPVSVLERELNNAKSIVVPMPKVYYCALNLPIKEAEKNQIKESLRSFLSIRQTMTEIEFLDVVLQICPHLLTEVSFLSWKGLRESLEYVFRDVVAVRDSQIVRHY